MSAARETSNKATVRRLADAINSGDAELVSKTIEEIFDPEVKQHTPFEVTGTQALKEMVFNRLYRAFPDLHVELEELIEEGDKVVEKDTVTGTHLGEFNGLPPTGKSVAYSGTVSRDGSASGTLTVSAASIDTGNTQRDTHLRSADFFGNGNSPDITFTAGRIRPSSAGVAVAGALTVRDRSRALSFDPEVSVPGDGEIWLDAEVRVNRADFGLTWNRLGMVSPTITVTIHAVFTRQ